MSWFGGLVPRVSCLNVAGAISAVLLVGLGPAELQAQTLQTLTPPSGKGPALLVVSGQSGPSNYAAVAKMLASRGYVVTLADGNELFRANNAGEAPFLAAVKAARAAPGATPGAIGVVGFSLGGAAALTYGPRMGADVRSVVAVYPYTSWIENPAAFVTRFGVPTLVLAATQDTYRDCCAIGTARALAKAAKAAGTLLRLVEYPQADHGFVLEGANYRAADTADVVRRISAHVGSAGTAR